MAADYGDFANGSSTRNMGHCLPNPVPSVDTELLLQTGGRGRVLEHEPLLRIDVTMGFLRHQRALVEAAQDQLDLAGIGIDVADGEDAGYVGLERGRLDR